MPGAFAGHGAMTLGKMCHEYWKRANVFPVAIVTFVCPFFYFFAVWQHGGNNTVVDVATLAAPCLVPPAKEVALDFASHHSADSSTDVATSSIGKVAAAASTTFVFEPCDVKYSEYTPCEDKDRSLRFERERLMYRERHCPGREELLRCMVPAPAGYRAPFPWPASRELAWFANVPHRELTVEKANQNWIRVEGERLRFPGGGTMFPRGAAAYIDDIASLIPLSDGSIRTAVDTGCGVSNPFSLSHVRHITYLQFYGLFKKMHQSMTLVN